MSTLMLLAALITSGGWLWELPRIQGGLRVWAVGLLILGATLLQLLATFHLLRPSAEAWFKIKPD